MAAAERGVGGGSVGCAAVLGGAGDGGTAASTPLAPHGKPWQGKAFTRNTLGFSVVLQPKLADIHAPLKGVLRLAIHAHLDAIGGVPHVLHTLAARTHTKTSRNAIDAGS